MTGSMTGLSGVCNWEGAQKLVIPGRLLVNDHLTVEDFKMGFLGLSKLYSPFVFMSSTSSRTSFVSDTMLAMEDRTEQTRCQLSQNLEPTEGNRHREKALRGSPIWAAPGYINQECHFVNVPTVISQYIFSFSLYYWTFLIGKTEMQNGYNLPRESRNPQSTH